jgi:uncharacterized membrane protein YkvA (DUF1232 family)
MTDPEPHKPQRLIPYRTNAFVRFANYLNLFWRLLLDRRVGFLLKLIPIGALIYVISPLDWIIPVVDDLVIAALAVVLFVELSPPEIAAEHRKAIESVLVGKWRDAPDETHIPEEEIIEGEFHEER